MTVSVVYSVVASVVVSVVVSSVVIASVVTSVVVKSVVTSVVVITIRPSVDSSVTETSGSPEVVVSSPITEPQEQRQKQVTAHSSRAVSFFIILLSFLST